MKGVKLCGLTFGVALVAMAFLAVTSASATVLCESETGSPCAKPLPSGTAILSELEEKTEEILTEGEVTIKCKKMSMKAKTLSSGGKGLAVKAEISGWTFGECTSGGKACTVEAAKLPYSAEIQATEKGNGNLVAANGQKTTLCNGVFCFYENPTVTRTIESGHPAHLRESTKWSREVGSDASCAMTMTESNRQVITSPTWLWVWPF